MAQQLLPSGQRGRLTKPKWHCNLMRQVTTPEIPRVWGGPSLLGTLGLGLIDPSVNVTLNEGLTGPNPPTKAPFVYSLNKQNLFVVDAFPYSFFPHHSPGECKQELGEWRGDGLVLPVQCSLGNIGADSVCALWLKHPWEKNRRCSVSISHSGSGPWGAAC